MEETAPSFLKNIEGGKIDGYLLHFGETKKLRLKGWTGFELYLIDSKNKENQPLVIRGIYSAGGKGVKPWMDIVYLEEVKGLGVEILRRIGKVIPPGGHLMISYEEEQEIHNETRKALNIGIPPVLTPLGFIIFQAGFQYIKDWYIAEGGYEGPRKLWGEKAPDEKWAGILLEKTGQEISRFLKKERSQRQKWFESRAIERAKEIFKLLK